MFYRCCFDSKVFNIKFNNIQIKLFYKYKIQLNYFFGKGKYIMHSYFSCAGFSKYKVRSEVKEILDRLQEDNIQGISIGRNEEDELVWELYVKISESIRICINGYIDEKSKDLIRERYYPCLIGGEVSSMAESTVYRLVDYEYYSVIIDDSRLGISVIYRMINNLEYINRKNKKISTKVLGTYISAWAKSAKIILPLFKTFEQAEFEKIESLNRSMRIDAAKNGDEIAMEVLSEEDMFLYEMASRRLEHEDIYSIVDTCILPKGVECEIYSIVGDIVDFRVEGNTYSKEEIYIFTVNCKDIVFDMAVPKINLEGDPKIGRRIKAEIWMQGIALFEV